jgi:hypothetical protein
MIRAERGSADHPSLSRWSKLWEGTFLFSCRGWVCIVSGVEADGRGAGRHGILQLLTSNTIAIARYINNHHVALSREHFF